MRRYLPNVGEGYLLRAGGKPLPDPEYVQGSWALIRIELTDGSRDDMIIHESEFPRGVPFEKALPVIVHMHFYGRPHMAPLKDFEFVSWI